MVGRVVDPDQLPGGAVLLLKKARDAGGWFTWATAGTLTKPVKVTDARPSDKVPAVYEDRPHDRVLVKGRHRDGRRFVVQYVRAAGGKWSAARAYVRHDGHLQHVGVAEAKEYLSATLKSEGQEVEA